MDTSKIIKGVVNSGRYTVTAPIVKEDYGLYLQIEGVELPQTYEVDFSNSEHNGTSVTMIGNSDGVLIPHQFISTGKDIFAFLYHVGEDFGRTVYKFRIPNKVRPDRTEEQPTPEEQSVIDQAISALNEAVAQTAQDVISADQSAQSAQGYAEQSETAKSDAQTFAQRSANSAQASADYSESAQASATASAQSASQSAQIKADVEDLVDDAQGYANASAQSATASATSVTQAQGYARSASASVQSASGYASNAQTSANTASSKAAEASTSAQTASTKASEANQSAVNASASASQAESAKTASQTAQGVAESARDTAVQAKNDAESARDTAQTLVDGITGKVEQIDSNTERIESLEDDKYKPYVVDSASGSIASFPDGADNIPLKSLVVDINPIQDLSHGDPSPENICPISGWTSVGVNQFAVNIFDKAQIVDGYINDANGELRQSLNHNKASDYIPVVPNATYYIKSEQTKGAWGAWYDKDKNFVSGISGYIANTSEVNKIKTAPSNARYMRLTVEREDGTSYVGNVDTFSVNYPSTDHSYHPYTGRSITINLGQTVYGGKLDVLSGELTVDKAMVDLGTLNWTSEEDFVIGQFRVSQGEIARLNPNYSLVQCSILKGVSPRGYAQFNNGEIGLSNSSTAPMLRVRAESFIGKTAEEIKAIMQGQQLVYELVEPIEIQLTPNEVNSLLGVNNIWADTGGTEVEYRADPDLYIQQKIPEVPVQDVQINGTSILSDGVANVPIAKWNTLGLVKPNGGSYGINVDTDGSLRFVVPATDAIKTGQTGNRAITVNTQHASTFYGLAKSAGDTTQSQSSNAVGNYTDEAKIAIQKMLGLYKAPYRLIKTIEITEETGTITIVADDNGDAFALTDVIVYFDGMVANGTSNGIVSLNNDTLADRPFVTLANLYNTTAQTRDAKLSVDGGRFIGWSSGNTFTNSYSAISLQQNKNACGIIQHGIIDTLLINSLNSHKFTSGTITIYGR